MQGTHFTQHAQGGSIKRQIVNPDLLEERNKCTFDQAEVSQLLHIPGLIEFFDRLAKNIRDNPELKFTPEFFEMTREEQMKFYWNLAKKQLEVDKNLYFYEAESSLFSPSFIQPGIAPMLLNYGMFDSALKKLGSDEQYAKLKDDVKKMRKLGCYAQTELGHGSNVAGIETTATLDQTTDEFVIHSPTVTSTKYWPGGLGFWANHAVVFAKCIVDGNEFGVQAFLVQIRDMETHFPLAGVKVGDIGPKLGYNSKDNGWLMFDKVRIPRTNMLCRFAYIAQDGTFEIRGNPKAVYQTMVEIRYQIVAQAGHVIRRALIIGVRYAACRRQFSSIPGTKSERKLLDYQSHMFKFGPLLADAYVLSVVGVQIHKSRELMNEEVKVGKFKTLDFMHHMTSGLKSIYSQMAYDSIDLVRSNCGGAGYSVWSGLPQQFADYSPVPTYEGDNTVMAQQTISYLKKKLKKIEKGIPTEGFLSYLNRIRALLELKTQAKTVDHFLQIQHLDDALAVRAAYMVSQVLQKLADSKESHKVKVNDLFAQDIIQMNRAHMMYLSFVIFRQEIETRPFKDKAIKPLMELLGKIFALKQLGIDASACYETGFFGHGSKPLLLEATKQTMVQLRPHIVPLTELNSDELVDQSHLSAIGNKWGDIYEAQLERAIASRLNKTPKLDFWDTLVKPIMTADAKL